MVRCSLADVVGLINPRPPSRAGSANSSRVCSPGGGCPVSAGMTCELIGPFTLGHRLNYFTNARTRMCTSLTDHVTFLSYSFACKGSEEKTLTIEFPPENHP